MSAPCGVILWRARVALAVLSLVGPGTTLAEEITASADAAPSETPVRMAEPAPSETTAPTEEPARTSAVWIQQPALTGLFALFGDVFVSGGANVELAPNRVFVFEITAIRVDQVMNLQGAMKYWQAGAAVGYLQPIVRSPNVGLYLSPKVFTLLSSEESWAAEETWGSPVALGGTSFESHLGADLVLQVHFGPLFFATMAGLSAGYCFNCVDGMPTAYGGQAIWRLLLDVGGDRRNRPALTLNFNMLRIGYTW